MFFGVVFRSGTHVIRSVNNRLELGKLAVSVNALNRAQHKEEHDQRNQSGTKSSEHAASLVVGSLEIGGSGGVVVECCKLADAVINQVARVEFNGHRAVWRQGQAPRHPTKKGRRL